MDYMYAGEVEESESDNSRDGPDFSALRDENLETQKGKIRFRNLMEYNELFAKVVLQHFLGRGNTLESLIQHYIKIRGKVHWVDMGAGYALPMRQLAGSRKFSPEQLQMTAVDLIGWLKKPEPWKEVIEFYNYPPYLEWMDEEFDPNNIFGDATEVRLPEGELPDIITSVQSFQYIPDKLRAFVNWYNQLEDGGVLLLNYDGVTEKMVLLNEEGGEKILPRLFEDLQAAGITVFREVLSTGHIFLIEKKEGTKLRLNTILENTTIHTTRGVHDGTNSFYEPIGAEEAIVSVEVKAANENTSAATSDQPRDGQVEVARLEKSTLRDELKLAVSLGDLNNSRMDTLREWEIPERNERDLREIFESEDIGRQEAVFELFLALIKLRLRTISPKKREQVIELLVRSISRLDPNYIILEERTGPFFSMGIRPFNGDIDNIYLSGNPNDIVDLDSFFHEIDHAFFHNETGNGFRRVLRVILSFMPRIPIPVFSPKPIFLHMSTINEYIVEGRALGAEWEFVKRIPPNLREELIYELEERFAHSKGYQKRSEEVTLEGLKNAHLSKKKFIKMLRRITLHTLYVHNEGMGKEHIIPWGYIWIGGLSLMAIDFLFY